MEQLCSPLIERATDLWNLVRKTIAFPSDEKVSPKRALLNSVLSTPDVVSSSERNPKYHRKRSRSGGSHPTSLARKRLKVALLRGHTATSGENPSLRQEYTYDALIRSYETNVEMGYVLPLDFGLSVESTKFLIDEAVSAHEEYLRNEFGEFYDEQGEIAEQETRKMNLQFRKACNARYEQEHLALHKEAEDCKYDHPCSSAFYDDVILTDYGRKASRRIVWFNIKATEAKARSLHAAKILSGQAQLPEPTSDIFLDCPTAELSLTPTSLKVPPPQISAPTCRKIDIFDFTDSDSEMDDDRRDEEERESSSEEDDDEQDYQKRFNTILALKHLKRSIEFFEQDSMQQFFRNI